MKTKWDLMKKIMSNYYVNYCHLDTIIYETMYEEWDRQRNEYKMKNSCAMINEIKELIDPIECKQEFIKDYIDARDILESIRDDYAEQVFENIGEYLKLMYDKEKIEYKINNLKEVCGWDNE